MNSLLLNKNKNRRDQIICGISPQSKFKYNFLFKGDTMFMRPERLKLEGLIQPASRSHVNMRILLFPFS